MTRLSAHGIGVTLGGRAVLEAVDFAVGPGELVGLIGPNGAGKSTLLRVLAGLLAPDAGRVALDETPADHWSDRARARRVGYLPQAGNANWAVSVATLVQLGRMPHRGPLGGASARDRAAVARALDTCDVAHLAGRAVTTLSGGERSRVLLARALAGEPELLLADEPVSGLDPAHQLDVMDTLRHLVQAGAGVAVVLHDLSLAARYCERLVLIGDGRVAAQGPPESVLSDANLARCYDLTVWRGQVAGTPCVVPIARLSRRPNDADAARG
jgi:iron complex transport system ATP-binding protein